MKRKVALALLITTMINTSVSAQTVYSNTHRQRQMTTSANVTTENVGTGEKEDNILTVDEAVEKAISYSSSIKASKENAEVAKLNLDDATRDFKYATEWAENDSLANQINSLNLAIRSYDSSVKKTKDTIEYNIRKIFYSVLDCKRNIELYDKSLALREKQLKIAEVQLKLGKISQNAYDKQLKEYKTSQVSKRNLETTLSSVYASLNQLMGTNITSEYKIVVDKPEYEELGVINITSAINYAIDTNTTVKTAIDNAQTKKKAYDRFSSLNSVGKKESYEYAYTQATRDADNAKTSVSTAVKALCENISNAETTHTDNINKLSLEQQNLEIIQTQYKLGKTTQVAVDAQQLTVDQLKATIESEEYSHDLLVRQYKNSDLLV